MMNDDEWKLRIVGKILVHKAATELEVEIMIEGHCDSGGRQGKEVTRNLVEEKFELH